MTKIEVPAAMFETLRQAEALADEHGEHRLSGDLYALGCWLGSQAQPVERPKADPVPITEEQRAALSQRLARYRRNREAAEAAVTRPARRNAEDHRRAAEVISERAANMILDLAEFDMQKQGIER